jgi:hypothetical protein
MNSDYYKNITESDQLIIVSANPAYIKYFSEPSEAVQIEAVKHLDYSSEQISMISYTYSHKYYLFRYINSPKALDLYEKLNKVGKIII